MPTPLTDECVMTSGIYQISNLISGKRYIGSARNLRQRRWYHLSALRHGRHHNRHLQRAFDKAGEDTFVFSILEYVSESNRLIEREQYFFDMLAPEYNFCPVAESALGYCHTPEACAKISETHKGVRNPFFGKYHSDETKRKMSEAHRGERNHMYGRRGAQSPNYGRRQSEESCRNNSIAHMGHLVSEKTKTKISEALRGNQNSKGRVCSNETRRKISEAWTPECRQRASDWMRQLNERRA